MRNILVLMAICVATLGLLLKAEEQPINAIQVGGTILDKIEIVNSYATRELGLSGRTSIDDDFGMLFVFKMSDYYKFWMKDMNFPIDMIWLDRNFRIVGLKSDATPESYPETFSPDKPALYVIEAHAGIIESQKIKIGDQLKVYK